MELLPRPLVVTWALLVGAVLGSFLNVVIARLPAGQSVVRPRSRCPGCGAPIAWYDNLPILSWLLLRARCRHCRAPISARYPLVETLGAGAAWLAVERHGLSVAALAELLFAADLVALTFIDADTWELPHVLTWPLIAGGLLAAAFGVGAAPSLASSAWGAGVGFASFALVSVVGEKVFHRPALGFGDVFLLSGLGAWLGVAALLPLVMLASLQGAAVGLALLGLGRMPKDPADAPAPSPASSPNPDPDPDPPPAHAVPFGPFLALGALEWLYASGLIGAVVPALGMFR